MRRHPWSDSDPKIGQHSFGVLGRNLSNHWELLIPMNQKSMIARMTGALAVLFCRNSFSIKTIYLYKIDPIYNFNDSLARAYSYITLKSSALGHAALEGLRQLRILWCSSFNLPRGLGNYKCITKHFHIRAKSTRTYLSPRDSAMVYMSSWKWQTNKS